MILLKPGRQKRGWGSRVAPCMTHAPPTRQKAKPSTLWQPPGRTEEGRRAVAWAAEASALGAGGGGALDAAARMPRAERAWRSRWHALSLTTVETGDIWTMVAGRNISGRSRANAPRSSGAEDNLPGGAASLLDAFWGRRKEAAAGAYTHATPHLPTPSPPSYLPLLLPREFAGMGAGQNRQPWTTRKPLGGRLTTLCAICRQHSNK